MKRFAVVVALALAGCPEPVVPKPAPIPEDTDWCGAAEQRLEELQCKDMRGDPMWVNKNGERFKQTCETAQEEGRVALNPRCIAEAPSCEEAKRCPAI
jgi:hypothetical protein